MTIWIRIIVTIVVMILASLIAAWLWKSLLGGQIPSYISGLIGGLFAIPVWEILQKYKAKPQK